MLELRMQEEVGSNVIHLHPCFDYGPGTNGEQHDPPSSTPDLVLIVTKR